MFCQRRLSLLYLAGVPALGAAQAAAADVVWFIERAEWEGAIGDYCTIDFTGFPHGTVVTEQYANLGAHFTDANDTIYYNPSSFYNDDYGLDGNGDITVTFDAPMYWLAVDYPGYLQVDLYSGSQPVYSSGPIGGGGAGWFFGLLSTEPFDAAVLIDPLGEAAIDDLHFGPPIPAPPAIALLALAACAAPRRLRRPAAAPLLIDARVGRLKGVQMLYQGKLILIGLVSATALGAAKAAAADVIWYGDRAEWEAAIGDYCTIDFTGFAHGTLITEQYAGLGAHFTDGTDTVYFNSTAFPNDEYGLDGNGDITVVFDQPIFWIAVDFPGAIQYELYNDGQLIHVSDPFGGGGAGFFVGLVSTEPFDMAVLIDPIGAEAAIDDLHFGPPIPAPPALALLALAAARPGRRRRP